ncbi:hypothetical protein KEM54_005677 [Ascosphaera aggregata]|nr:hypothetical protein KEM54_005677 [Ascosphaera aggregata]
MEVQTSARGEPPVVAQAPSLLHSNLENLLTDTPTRDTSAGNENGSPVSPSRGMLDNIFKKRKRGQSSPRIRTPASDILKRAFTAGHGFMEPAVPNPPVSSTPAAGTTEPLDSAQQYCQEPLGYSIVRKVRRLMGWSSQRPGPAKQEPEPIDVDGQHIPQSCTTLFIDTPTMETPSLPSVPRNSPVRSEYQQLPSHASDQQQQQSASQGPMDDTAETTDANADNPKPQSPKLSIAQRIKERVGAMNRFLSRESGRWFRIRTFPYEGHLEEEQPPFEIEMERPSPGGYEGDNEGQGDNSSGFSRPTMSVASAVMPPLRSEHRSSSLSQPTVERIDEASKEGSSALSGSLNTPQLLSGDEGDDESSRKVKRGKSK